MTMNTRALGWVTGLAAMIAVTAPAAARITCWTDDQGRRACGDVVPPEVRAKERQIINPRGVVVETRQRAPTEAERQAQAEATLRAAESAEAARRDAAYDQFLLQTYRDLSELEAQGRRRLEVLDGQHRLAEKAVQDTERSLADLRGRVAALNEADKPVPPRLEQQLAQFEANLAEHRKALDGITGQRDTLITRYAQDAERFQRLTESSRP